MLSYNTILIEIQSKTTSPIMSYTKQETVNRINDVNIFVCFLYPVESIEKYIHKETESSTAQ
jgi:hypothetical protein